MQGIGLVSFGGGVYGFGYRGQFGEYGVYFVLNFDVDAGLFGGDELAVEAVDEFLEWGGGVDECVLFWSECCHGDKGSIKRY